MTLRIGAAQAHNVPQTAQFALGVHKVHDLPWEMPGLSARFALTLSEEVFNLPEAATLTAVCDRGDRKT